MDTDVDDWIEQQLHPEEINDSVLDGKLGPFRTLRMSTRDLVQTFPNNNLIKAAAEGKVPLPADPVKRSIYEVQIKHPRRAPKQDQLAADGKAPDTDAKRQKIEPKIKTPLLPRPTASSGCRKEKRMEAIIALPVGRAPPLRYLHSRTANVTECSPICRPTSAKGFLA